MREKAGKVEIKSVSLRKKGTSDFTIAKKRERERHHVWIIIFREFRKIANVRYSEPLKTFELR